MDQTQIHFEVFASRPGSTARRLELATEDRAAALEAAEELLASGRAACVQVSKEILYPDTREFKSVTIFERGAPARVRVRKPVEQAPLCVGPADLYTAHARGRIADLLEDWLARHKVTAFELLHRPDLVEKLEASGVEMQHAIQKVALPEAEVRGQPVHQMIRHFQALVERTASRLVKDGRAGAFPDLDAEPFAAACRRLASQPDHPYLIGGAIAAHLADAAGWAGKVERLLDLADAAPASGPARALAFTAIEQPLGEILAARVGLQDLLGAGVEFGDGVAALIRLAAGKTIDLLLGADASVAPFLPELTKTAARLARCLEDPLFTDVRVALGARLLREIASPKRLRPADPRAEIETLRAMAKALTAAAGPLLPLDQVREAFTTRSRSLVSTGFISLLMGENRPALAQAQDLVWLLENVTGAANKRTAAQCLLAHIGSLRFETEMRGGSEPLRARLLTLARLQRLISRMGDEVAECAASAQAIGQLGATMEAEAGLVAAIGRAQVSASERLLALLKLATGETAPLGPAADRAGVQALKLLRSDEARQLLRANATADLEPIHALLRTYQQNHPRAA